MSIGVPPLHDHWKWNAAEDGAVGTFCFYEALLTTGQCRGKIRFGRSHWVGRYWRRTGGRTWVFGLQWAGPSQWTGLVGKKQLQLRRRLFWRLGQRQWSWEEEKDVFALQAGGACWSHNPLPVLALSKVWLSPPLVAQIKILQKLINSISIL